jgi:hypothetical protein
MGLVDDELFSVASLVADLNEARTRFAGFQAHFFGLSANLVERIEAEEWWKRDRTSKRVSAKVVTSAYSYDSGLKGKHFL